MNRYLRTKLAEEGSEVAQAACKTLLDNGPTNRRRLLEEMADMQAMIDIATDQMDSAELYAHKARVSARFRHEKKKGRA